MTEKCQMRRGNLSPHRRTLKIQGRFRPGGITPGRIRPARLRTASIRPADRALFGDLFFRRGNDNPGHVIAALGADYVRWVAGTALRTDGQRFGPQEIVRTPLSGPGVRMFSLGYCHGNLPAMQNENSGPNKASIRYAVVGKGQSLANSRYFSTGTGRNP